MGTMSGRRLEVGHISLHLVDEGSGQPVLLLHGFPDSSRLWRNQVPALVSHGLRAIVPDLRGFGQSDRPTKGRHSYSMQRILGDLTGLLDALGLEKVHVVGHDWGAIAAWALAGWHPDRVDELVVISVGHPRGLARPRPSQVARSWYAVAFSMPWLAEKLFTARDWRLFRAIFGRSPDFDQYLVDLARPGALTAGLNWYRANHLLTFFSYPRVSSPVMGVWGSKDWALGEAQMVASKDYVDGPWRYERIEAGHWIPLRRPELLNALLIDFFH